ncbi:hypothetical protein EIK77_007451 [Talaromyces pinophilus]|nr:hypothetical protein EIK77_007451 [Talaromyces pinophilus]
MMKNAFDKSEVLEPELEIMRTLYNTFPSLKEVIIEIYSVGIKKDVRQRFLDHGFKVEYIKNESDDTQEWIYHRHEDCDIYYPYDERDYEGGFDDTDDDDDDSSSIAGNSCVVS